MSEQPHTDTSRLEPDSAPLAGRHALITGGGKGIGAAIAEALAGLGASLTLVGRDQGALDARREALCATSAVPIATHRADITDPDAVAAAFERAHADNGPVTILINNAGVAQSAPFGRTKRALRDAMLAINVTAAFTCTQVALPAMRAEGWGRVINIASTAGLQGYRYVSAYSAAKHALVGLTRSLALELADRPITVNAVCPGFTDTDLLHRSVRTISETTGIGEDEARTRLAATNPQGRLITPAEVAHTVAWLCHPKSGSITGQAVVVAGGEVM